MKPPDRQPPCDDPPGMLWDADDPNQPLGDARMRELADDVLVHALLVGRFQDTPEAASERVDRVCLAFERSFGATRWYWRVGLSTAAAIIVVGLALFFLPTQNVQAQFSQVLNAFDVGDKTYQVDIGADTDEPSPASRKGWTRPTRRPPFKPARGRMPAQRLDGALLYVRNHKHVLTYTMPTGMKIARGFDGQRSWITGPQTRSNAFGSPTHPWRKIPAGSDPNLSRAEIPDEAVSLLLVDLRDMLHQIRKNYTLSQPTASPAPGGQTSILYFAADRVTPRARLPRRIELWVDAQTGQIHDLVCTGVSFHRSAARYVLRITLVSADSLSSDWFTPQAHLARE